MSLERPRPRARAKDAPGSFAVESFFFHPKVVHLPIALGVLMPLVSGGLMLAWWRAWLPARAWFVAVALQAVLVASGFAALWTGGAEEERVEELVPEGALEAHEEAAQLYVAGAALVLGLMGLALGLPSKRAGLTLATASALGSLVVLGLGVRTGEAGGALVYRHGAAQAYITAGPGGATGPAAPAADDDD